MLKILNTGIKKFSRCTNRLQINNNGVQLIENYLKKIRIFDEIDLYPAGIDWGYVLNPLNMIKIENNITARKGNGDISALVNYIALLLVFNSVNNSTN